MKPIAMFRKQRLFGILRLAALALTLVITARLQASGPIEPLPGPYYYSFDLESPHVWAGVVEARDILRLGPDGPEEALDGLRLGLLSSFDDLDGLSGPHLGFSPTATFVLMFSVDRYTQGLTPPDPLLVGLDVPYNVLDQALRGQAAGDEYFSTTLFTLDAPPPRGTTPKNNCLARNNFDEGGSDFGGDPPTSASETASPSSYQDDVDAVSGLTPTARGAIENVYFSVTSGSPSLATLPGSYPSGATIFFNHLPAEGTPTEVYAPFYSLGLQQADDIDALLVFDLNYDGVYDAQDVVLFSLAPGSPSLAVIGQASPVGAAADVFIARANLLPPVVHVFAHADDLGLGAPPDDIDALDLFLCPDAIQCAALHGIRYPRGDLNCDHLVNAFDIDPFVLALTSPAEYHAAFPDCDIARADINRDGLINAFDIDPFVILLTGGR
jgi:hypothetical protein